MATINIPDAVIPGIKAIGLLSEKELNVLYEDLRHFPKGAKIEELKDVFSKSFGDDQGELLSTAIFSFGYLLVREESSTEEISKNLRLSFLSQIEDGDVSNELGDTIQERLNDILMLSDFLIPTFEAYRVIWDNNIVITASEISTEVVILNDKRYSIPAAAVLINKLKIESRKDGRGQDFIFALDNADLLKLKTQIDMTLKESEQIQKQYNSFLTFIAP